MKQSIYLFIIIVLSSTLFSCEENEPQVPVWKDLVTETIHEYITENDSLFSKFDTLLQVGQLDKTMSAYNPDGDGYTMFLPTNNAIDEFIAESSRFSSFEDLLNDKAYVSAMVRYHVVNIAILTNDFPYGALPELNLSKQYLTIGYDAGIYKVNNIAPITNKNIECSNGFIDVISKAIEPVTFTTYDWIKNNPDFSIFAEAVDATGFQDVLNKVVVRDTISESPLTLFVEPDTVYHRNNIFTLNDLIEQISPLNSDYNNQYNPLYNFVGYHILDGSLFLSNFEENATNYSSLGDNPININGYGIDLAINKGKEVFDTIVSSTNDSTFIDYITFYYDYSNILTQSGTIHLINQIMLPKQAGRAELWFQFTEDQLLYQYSEEEGEFLIEEKELLSKITWTGGDDKLVFVQSEDEANTAWNKNYLIIEGDFSISYTLPSMVIGNYNLLIRAHANDIDNAVVEVFFDGVKIGGLVNLTTGGDSGDPYIEFELGTVSLLSYETHVITVQSLIPGIFNWDCVHFEPI